MPIKNETFLKLKLLGYLIIFQRARLCTFSYPDSTGWDATVWLTRAPLGGPSGFAPVGGVCTRTRSAAIDRDEGLTSAFVIAHELAHL